MTQVLPAPFGIENADPYDVQYKQAIGNATHRAIHLDVRSDLNEETVDVEVWPYLRGWRQFVADTGYRSVLSHERLYSELYEYSGELDAVGILNGRIIVPDFKCCAAKPGPIVGLQLAAYAQLLRENFKGQPIADVRRRFALWFTPERAPGYVLVPFDKPSDWPDFLSYLNVWKFETANGLRRAAA
ncbi:MAG TPA: hypothetical protein VFB99_16320 [Vicinamibacterales bacterium]|nr:hypothetical protein [Vicinamibacterales bacterium]